MQKIIFDDSQARAGNVWAAGRRDFLLRELVNNYDQLQQRCRSLEGTAEEKRVILQTLLGLNLAQSCTYIWPQQAGPGFATTCTLITLQLEKLVACMQMSGLSVDDGVLAQGLATEVTQQEALLADLLDQADVFLYDVLLVEAGNPLLLRLLLENPQLPVTLWQKDLVDLLSNLFPQAPDMAYLYAGKSYFNGHWLEQSLAAFDQALALNPDQEEARRRSHIVRGMLRDKSMRNKETKK